MPREIPDGLGSSQQSQVFQFVMKRCRAGAECVAPKEVVQEFGISPAFAHKMLRKLEARSVLRRPYLGCYAPRFMPPEPPPEPKAAAVETSDDDDSIVMRLIRGADA